jgi:heme A synthase
MAHRWLGTSTAVWIVLTAVVAWRDARRGTSRHMRVMLVVAVLLTMLTAHLGGLLDRGVDFFDW